MQAILPSDSRFHGRQGQRVSSGLLGRVAGVAAFMVMAVWVLTGERVSTYMQRQPNLHLVHGLGSSRGPQFSNGLHDGAGGVLESGSIQLLELAGDDWAYGTLTDPVVLNSGALSDASGFGAITTSSKKSSGGGISSGRRSNSSLSSSSSGRGGGFSSSYSSQLLSRLLAEKQRAQDPEYIAKLRAAAAKPIDVLVMSGLFWALKEVHSCSVDGVPLTCRFTMHDGDPQSPLLDSVDALYYHVPSFTAQPRPKAFPEQLRLAMSLESAAYYPELDDPAYMCRFDAEMTYRHCAQVINWYSLDKFSRLFKDPLIPQVPFEEKLHAIAYVNSNCGAQSGRSDIMKALIALGDKAKVPVHSYGQCDKNMEWPEDQPSKFGVFSRYKFCVTMENSLRQDYISEKLWDGLVSGCVPVYLGSSSARDIVPDPDSFIMYEAEGQGDASTPEELDALMHAIGSDKQRYEAMLAWKHREPQQQPNVLFRELWEVQHTSGECFLCEFLARHRVDPQPNYNTCLFNKDWMTPAGQPYVSKEEACSAPQPAAAVLDDASMEGLTVLTEQWPEDNAEAL